MASLLALARRGWRKVWAEERHFSYNGAVQIASCLVTAVVTPSGGSASVLHQVLGSGRTCRAGLSLHDATTFGGQQQVGACDAMACLVVAVFLSSGRLLLSVAFVHQRWQAIVCSRYQLQQHVCLLQACAHDIVACIPPDVLAASCGSIPCLLQAGAFTARPGLFDALAALLRPASDAPDWKEAAATASSALGALAWADITSAEALVENTELLRRLLALLACGRSRTQTHSLRALQYWLTTRPEHASRFVAYASAPGVITKLLQCVELRMQASAAEHVAHILYDHPSLGPAFALQPGFCESLAALLCSADEDKTLSGGKAICQLGIALAQAATT